MGVSLDKSAWGPDAHRVMSFLAMDPPRQTRLRSLVSKGFTPRRVRELAPQIQRLTDHYLDRAPAGLGIVRLDRRLRRQAPDGRHLRADGRARGRPRRGTPARRPRGAPRGRRLRRPPGRHGGGAHAWSSTTPTWSTQRRRQPTDDLTSALLAAEIDGDRLSDEEIIAFLFLMVVAGNETTTKLLGNALYHLTRHPDQLAAGLRRRGDTGAGRAVDRGDAALRHLQPDARPATCSTTSSCTAGWPRAGSKLLLVLGSANRDERVFAAPTSYDIDRDKDELAQLLSFGGGRHFCLGANLARLEAQVALTRARTRGSAPSTSTTSAAVRVHSANVRGFAESCRCTVRGALMASDRSTPSPSAGRPSSPARPPASAPRRRVALATAGSPGRARRAPRRQAARRSPRRSARTAARRSRTRSTSPTPTRSRRSPRR